MFNEQVKMNDIKKKNIVILAFLICCLSALFIDSGRAAGASESVDFVLDNLQERYTGMTCFSADFKQTFLSSDTGTSLEESGSLIIKKGGFMRWEYKEPEEKLFICDGSDCYLYIVEEKIVQVISLKNIDARSTPMLFFAGKGDLKRDFESELLTEKYSKGSDPGLYRIKMKPKGEQEQFEYMIAMVDKKSFIIKRILVVDLLGNQTDYLFNSIRELNTLPDSKFRFTPPEGVEIVKIEE
jgi:outer membrane lipoprotein carrier protein